MHKISDLLSTVTFGQAQIHENLTIYPLHIENGHTRGYQTLNEALESKEVVINEINESGSVPNLNVQNSGTHPVLIVVGEELVGAKQNRVLNTSLLVPAKSDLQVPVSCVEQGRWHYTSRSFDKSTQFGHSSLRKAQTRNVTKSLRTRNLHDADQSEVWGEVTRTLSSHKSSSATASLHDVYEQTNSKLKAYADALQAPESEGFLVAINGTIVGGDIFDHHETLKILWEKLVRSYALDALEKKSQPSSEQAESPDMFIASAKEANKEVYDAVGLGEEVRLTSDDVTGSSLVWNELSIHTSLFKNN